MDIAAFADQFQAAKLVLLADTGLAKDALHIYFGLALFVAVRLIWRRSGGWLLAWLAVLALALTVEWLDMHAEAIGGKLQPDKAHWHDVWNTMFWPTVLLLVGRWLHPRPAPVADPLSDAEPLCDQGTERGIE